MCTYHHLLLQAVPNASSQFSAPCQTYSQLNGAVQKNQKDLPKSFKHYMFPWWFSNLQIKNVLHSAGGGFFKTSKLQDPEVSLV